MDCAQHMLPPSPKAEEHGVYVFGWRPEFLSVPDHLVSIIVHPCTSIYPIQNFRARLTVGPVASGRRAVDEILQKTGGDKSIITGQTKDCHGFPGVSESDCLKNGK